MELQKLVRGSVGWDDVERVVRELLERYDREEARVEFLDADNWLSTPFVFDDDLFVKVITRQNIIVHALFTTGRNLGAFSAGTEGFFERFETPYAMARHELEAMRQIQELGVKTPEPLEALEVGDLGVVVFEYLPEFRTLDELDREKELALAPKLFEALATLHEAGLAHGDLRAENVLIHEGDLYFIDATNVDGNGLGSARAYDLASALAALEPLIGAREAVSAALTAYTREQLLDARRFLDFIAIRPDHDFDATALKGELEKRASGNVGSDSKVSLRQEDAPAADATDDADATNDADAN